MDSSKAIVKRYITDENSNYFRIKIKYINKNNIKVSPEYKITVLVSSYYKQLFCFVLPGLQDESDQTACDPISRTVPVLSNCFGSAPGGVLFGVVIFKIFYVEKKNIHIIPGPEFFFKR